MPLLIPGSITGTLLYCNKLQYVQNSSARVLTNTRSWKHITHTHKRLQWPTVCFYIQYKILLLVPAWSIPQLIIWPLSSLLSNTKLSDLLTLTCSLSLHIDFSTVRDRLFVWNSFPLHLHAIPHLKTFPWFCQ